MVNLDTGTAMALVSEGSPLRHLLKATISRSSMVMTQTAVAEFQQIVRTIGGPLERSRAVRLLQRVQVIPDSPSKRALGLRPTKQIGTRDIIIFGTGDSLGAMTMTTDAKFVRGAAAQGVRFNVFVHAPVPLTGA
jgi:hypothetical protein